MMDIKLVKQLREDIFTPVTAGEEASREKESQALKQAALERTLKELPEVLKGLDPAFRSLVTSPAKKTVSHSVYRPFESYEWRMTSRGAGLSLTCIIDAHHPNHVHILLKYKNRSRRVNVDYNADGSVWHKEELVQAYKEAYLSSLKGSNTREQISLFKEVRRASVARDFNKLQQLVAELSKTYGQ